MGLRVFAIITVTMLAGLTQRGDVSAHAKILRAEPAPGSSVNIAPKAVRIWFTLSGNEELDPERSTISVLDSRGRRVDDGKGGVDLNDLDRRSMIVRLKPLQPGEHTVKWKAVSVPDLSVAQGVFRFRVVSRSREHHCDRESPRGRTLHIFVDGQLISMIGMATQKVSIPLGRHTISVELVANDHGAFCPAVSVARSVEVVR